MADSIIVNPAGVNAPQGNEVYTDIVVQRYISDPAGNTSGGAIVSISAAAAAVVTTTTAHGLVTGQTVTMAGSTWTGIAATTTVGTFTVTVTGATTFTIPVVTTGGTNTAVGTYTAQFVVGQLMALQSWTGAASGNAAASVFPTLTVCGLTAASAAQTLGPIIGGNTAAGPQAGAAVSVIPLGGIVQVAISGLAQVLYDATTTVGGIINVSGVNPGAAKTVVVASAAAATGLGFCTQVVTGTTAAKLLAWSFIAKT